MSEPRTFIFEIYKGGELLRTERLQLDVIKIGSHPKSGLFIDDSSVSRVHAVIEVTGEDIQIIDLGSARGTLVNGQRANKAKLSHRDRIQVGDVEVHFFTRDEKAEAEAARAAAIAAAEGRSKVRRIEEIRDEAVYGRRFLARPAATDGTVEVALLYRDFVIADLLFQPPAPVKVGSGKDCQLEVEHPDLPEGFELVSLQGTDPVLHFKPQMTGDLYLGTERFTLAGAVESGRARVSGGIASVPLSQDTRAKIVLGDLILFVHRSTKPKLVLPLNAQDLSQSFYFVASAIVHIAFLALSALLPPDIGRLAMDSFGQNDRFVQILIQEEETPPEEIPEWLREEEQEEEAAPLEEGRMGDENSEETDNRSAVAGDNEAGEPTELALRQAREEALQSGAMSVLNQFGPTSLFGSDASGYDDVMAIGNAVGTAPGMAYGTSGLGRYGGGMGGGGVGTRGGFGSGTFGVRGRSTGDTSIGSNVRNVSDRQVRQVSVDTGTPEIQGQLDREIIARVIREHRREVRACYEAELQRSPELEGRIVVSFVISPDGAVASSSVAESTMGNNAVESCITGRVRRWRFPEPRGGGIVRVSYPFVFTTG